MKSALGLAIGLVLVACGSNEDPSPLLVDPEPTDAGPPPAAALDAGPDAARGAAPPPAPAPLGFEVRGAALFQGVKLPLFGEKAKNEPLPVVVSRPGVVRFYFDLTAHQQPDEAHVTFRYRAADASVQTLTAVRPLTEDSTDARSETCADIALPAEAFHPSLAWQAELHDAQGRLVSRYPEDAAAFSPLPANPASQSVHVVVVPVEYTADGSHRLPDTSAAQLQRMSEQMRALYPVAEVAVTVRSEPLVWDTAIEAGGDGWDALLYGVLALRQSDAVADDVYYYGAFAPGATQQAFCASGHFGCVLGLSELSSTVDDAGKRGSIGLGFTGRDAAETFAHEVGHAHGRYHAPCGGAGGPDPRFPYPGGGLGVPGWDVRSGQFIPNAGLGAAKDFMGYCAPAWVSDYTWKALFTRIVGVAEEAHPTAQARPLALPVAYRMLRLEDGKAPRWVGARTARGRVSDQTIAATVSGHAIALPSVTLDHLPGQILYVPSRLAGQSLRVNGQTLTVP